MTNQGPPRVVVRPAGAVLEASTPRKPNRHISAIAVDVSSIDEAKRVASLAEEERRIIEAERRRLGLDA